MTGRFITVEGVEGAGKSTLIQALRAHLAASGREVLVLREPGGTAAGDRIRALLLDPGTGALVPRAELLLFCASRAQLVDTVIAPAIDRGAVVLCDRFTDSSMAYQGRARGLPEALVATLNDIATASLRPHLTLLVDLPVEVGLARARARRGLGDDDRFEALDLAFHERVRQAFLELAAAEPERFRILDGALAPEELAGAAIAAMEGGR